FSLGFIAGGLLAFAPVDLYRYYVFQRWIYGPLARPPILRWPWTPGAWARNFLSGLLEGPSYYLDGGRFWTISLQLYSSACVLGIAGALKNVSTQAARRWSRGLAFGLAIVIVGMIVLIKRFEAVYYLLLMPFVLPLS